VATEKELVWAKATPATAAMAIIEDLNCILKWMLKEVVYGRSNEKRSLDVWW
jgi:hypothetical protein